MTAPAETWRVECADGVTGESVPHDYKDGTWHASVQCSDEWGSHAEGCSAGHAVYKAAAEYCAWRLGVDDDPVYVVAIVAPGTPATAQRVAAAVAAEREACAREADEAAHRHDADAAESKRGASWERGAAYAARDLAAVIRDRGGA